MNLINFGKVLIYWCTYLFELLTCSLGVSNAVAGGMMIAACVSLTREGCHDSADVWSTIFGFFLGILFILITKNALSQYV